MIATCRKRRGKTSASWERILWGLWWSGLRINEIMHVTWNSEGLLTMDFSGKRPMFFIKAELSKNRKTERFPMAPEFYEVMMQVPKSERVGYVFDPKRKLETSIATGRMKTIRVSGMIADMGEASRIKVADTSKGPRFGSAHDLRRSFGFRWAKRVMPAILQRMMRHSDIQTTMEYYITQGEDETADAVWEAHGSSLRKRAENRLAARCCCGSGEHSFPCIVTHSNVSADAVNFTSRSDDSKLVTKVIAVMRKSTQISIAVNLDILKSL